MIKRRKWIERRTPIQRGQPPTRKTPLRRTWMKRGPSKKWRTRDDVEIKDDGREVCNKHTPGGLKDYKARLWTCYERQYDPQAGYVRCCNCLKRLIWPEACFEHENLRTPGKIDERVEVKGKRLNGASHVWCNGVRGSRRTKIWHGPPEKLWK